MRLYQAVIVILITFEMCQTAYRRNRGGRARPIPRLIANRPENHIRTNRAINEANLVDVLESGHSAKTRTKQKTADRNNLIQIETKPTTHLVKFSLLNAQSARNKANILNEYIVNDKINIAAITETWFTPDDEQLSNDLTPKGYDIFHATRDGRRGGGVALIAESRFKPSSIPTQTFASFVSISVKLSMKKAPLLVTTLYRPPEKPMGTFLSDFQTFLEEMLEFRGDILISGDFNIHIDNRTTSVVDRFHDLLDSFSLQQHVQIATHRSGHTLDLIITRSNELSPLAPPTMDTIVSDHFAISCHFCIEKPKYKTREITSRKLDKIDIKLFREELRQIPCLSNPPEDIDTLVNDFNTSLSVLLERHAPKQTRSKKIRPLNPWFDECILAAKKRKGDATNGYGLQRDRLRIRRNSKPRRLITITF